MAGVKKEPLLASPELTDMWFSETEGVLIQQQVILRPTSFMIVLTSAATCDTHLSRIRRG